MNPPAGQMAMPVCAPEDGNPGVVPAGNEAGDSDELVVRAQAGDRESFCKLCRLHEGRLLALATVACQDPTLAADLAQEVLFAAWQSLGRYNGQCRFFTWLCAILLNRVRHERRKRRPLGWFRPPRAEPDAPDRLLDRLVDPQPLPDHCAEAADLAAAVRACLERLPAAQREVVFLRFYADSSLEDVAVALGCSLGTVKSRLFHALGKLRLMRDLRQELMEP
jgi:RNA polymerase sigma-70 factor (ECF subfamily)